MEQQQIENQNDNGNKKKTANIVTCILLAVIGLVFITFAIVNLINMSPSTKDKLEITNTELVVDSYVIDSTTYYNVYVQGTAKNISNKNYSYASVEFSVYDADNNNLGTALANINNLASGDTWQFNAMLINTATSAPTTYKLVKITVF